MDSYWTCRSSPVIEMNGIFQFVTAISPFTRVADLPSRRSLRSVGTNRLVVPTSRLSTVRSRAFPVAGPQT